VTGGRPPGSRGAHAPRKRFGQHFLHDPAVVERIVAAVAPAPDDAVVEIGPGLGALTAPLLARLGRLQVVEIDRDLAARLRAGHAPERLVVHEADALEFDFGALGPGLRVVGNLPYNVSTPLLFRLERCAASLRDLHFMLQKEVVDRMVAPPGGAAYGRLSVTLQRRFAMTRLFDVGAGAFRPPPKVTSAVVRLVPRAHVADVDEQRFADIVRAAFTKRRKTLRNALAGVVAPEAIAAAGIDSGLRPEALGVAEYERLARYAR
jgi:16S rRNA (adenine1518-N6/adenine1519-N6)-dimethyltransferase